MRRGRLFKRGNTWTFVVDVAQKGQTREQRMKGGFATKAAAIDAMNRMQQQKADGDFVEPSRLALGAYLEQWLQGGELRGWEGNTARDYSNSVRNHVARSAIAKIPLQSLTKTHIEAFYAQLLKTGKKSRRRGDDSSSPLSRKMVQNVHIALRSALQDAVESDPPFIRKNPASKAFKYSRTKDRKELRTWSTEEVQQFLAFTTTDRDATLYRTALMTGMRRGELLGLRRQDVDVRSRRLVVRQQYARDGARGLRIKGLKTDTKAWRTIDLDEGTSAALEAHIAGQNVVSLDGLIFTDHNGAPLDVDSVTRRFQARAAAAGVRVIPFHGCRHTHATLLLENGESLKYVAERLGDREDTVLEIYGHVTSKMRAAAPSRLAALIDGPTFPAETVVLREHSVSIGAATGGSAAERGRS